MQLTPSHCNAMRNCLLIFTDAFAESPRRGTCASSSCLDKPSLYLIAIKYVHDLCKLHLGMPSERALGDCDIFTISWLVGLGADSLNNVLLVVPVWYRLGALEAQHQSELGSQGHVHRS